MTALSLASQNDIRMYVPNYQYCDWDDTTLRRLKGWRFQRLAVAYEEFAESAERHLEWTVSWKEQGEKILGGEDIDRDIRLQQARLKDLQDTPEKCRTEMSQVLEGLDPFEDKDIARLARRIVDREMGIEEVQLRFLEWQP